MRKTPAIDFDLLAMFTAVADEASFSRAARRLGITKGTVSRGVARLENLLGAELLHRTTHKVALSTAGTALYERAAPHLAALEQAVTGLPERAEQPSGLLKLTAPHDLGVMLLPEIVTQFSLRYPEVSFDIRLTNARLDLVDEGLDLAIRATVYKLEDSSLSVRKLGSSEIRYYTSPAYVARRGEPREFGDTKHDWVAFPGMPKAQTASARYSSNDFFLIRDLLRDGIGVGPLPTFLADPYVRSGLLVVTMGGARYRGGGGYFLLYPSGKPPRKVTAFRDFLLERVKARPIDGF